MTLEQFLELVRSGEVQLNLHPRGIKLVVQDDSKNDEILATMRDHLKAIIELLAINDTRICMSPDEHRANWQYQGTDQDGQLYTCEDCAAVRIAERHVDMPLDPTRTTYVDCKDIDLLEES